MSLVPLKRVAHINRWELPESTDPARPIRYVDISAVDNGGEITLPEATVTFAAAPSRARRLAPVGSTVLSTVRTYLHAIAKVEHPDLVFSTGFAVLEPFPQVLGGYLSYACRSSPFVDEVVAHSEGVSYPAINPSRLSSLKISIPNREEQRRIADFLDDKVTRIDGAIEGRGSTSRLLEEKFDGWLQREYERFASTSGKAPIRRFLRSIQQGWSPQCDDHQPTSDEWGVTKAGCVNSGEFDPMEAKTLQRGTSPRLEHAIHAGDLLINRASGSVDLIGRAAIVPESFRGRLLICDKIYRIFLRPEMRNTFFVAMWRARQIRERLRLMTSGAEGMANSLPSGVIRSVPMPQPAVDDQLLWVIQYEERRSSVHETAVLCEREIKLLKERKAALITAAVTGEFDVSTAGPRAVAAVTG